MGQKGRRGVERQKERELGGQIEYDTEEWGREDESESEVGRNMGCER